MLAAEISKYPGRPVNPYDTKTYTPQPGVGPGGKSDPPLDGGGEIAESGVAKPMLPNPHIQTSSRTGDRSDATDGIGLAIDVLTRAGRSPAAEFETPNGAAKPRRGQAERGGFEPPACVRPVSADALADWLEATARLIRAGGVA